MFRASGFQDHLWFKAQASTFGINKSLTGGHMGGCQNYGPVLGTLNIRGRIVIGIQKKGTIIFTTTHMFYM